MLEAVFVATLGVVLFALLHWGFRTLPEERWQIAATIPMSKESGRWRGLNLTYYGVFSATAHLLSVAVLFILFAALNLPAAATLTVAALTLAICVPASRWVARVVEKKLHTFSMAGAFFVGVVVFPPFVWLTNVTLGHHLGFSIDYLPAMAAIVVAYAFGEALGRLACISFGCCYGKALEQTPPRVQKLFARWHFIFHGETKKIAYAAGLDGAKVVPVQGITAVLYVLCGLLGLVLFLAGHYAASFVTTMLITQLWRAFSETLRADHRGGGALSAYQVMALAVSGYAVALSVWFVDTASPPPDLHLGLSALWHPGVLLILQALWLTIFVYTGRSAVTEADVSFRVCRDKI